MRFPASEYLDIGASRWVPHTAAEVSEINRYITQAVLAGELRDATSLMRQLLDGEELSLHGFGWRLRCAS
jgi:hypothetical protein